MRSFWTGETHGASDWTVQACTGMRSRAPRFSRYAQCVCVFITFWEVNDCVQWYRTSLSLLKGLGSDDGSSQSSPSVILPSSSRAEMGHQLQLVGVTWLEDAMTERFVRVEERDEEGSEEEER